MPPIFVPLYEQDQKDLTFMDAAVEMAEEAIRAAEIPVGCVFVQNDRILARGRNRTNETRNASLHAELDALSQILPKDSVNHLPTPLSDVTLYVTVEPCLMCASALRQVGIRKAFYGAANDRFGGCGGVLGIGDDPKLKYSPPLEALGGYRREEAIMLLRRFYITENTNAPQPKDKSKRVLKTDIVPVDPALAEPSPANLV